MQKRTFLALGFLVVVGGAVVWKQTRPDPNVRPRGASPVPQLKAADIDELDIAEPGKPEILLKKEQDEWRLVKPVADRADQKNVEAALTMLEKMTVGAEPVSESPSSHEQLGVKDDEVLKVTARKGGKPLVTLLVGKTGRHLRLEGSPRVYAVANLQRYSLAREVKMWRDREIVRFERDQLERLEVGVPGGPKVVARREAPPAPAETDPSKPKPPPGPEKWTLVEGADAVGGPIDKSVPSSIAGMLTRLDASDFPEGLTLEAAGLDRPRFAVTAVLADGSRKEILVGKEDNSQVYVKRPDSPRIWVVHKSAVDGFMKPPLQWRDKTLVQVETTALARVEVTHGEDHLVLEHPDDKTWRAVPEVKDLDPAKANMLAAGLASLRAASIEEQPDPKATGFDKPTAVIRVGKREGGQVTLTVGAKKDDSGYFVKVTGRDEVFLMPEYSLSRFYKKPAELARSASPGGGMPPGMAGMPMGR